MSTKFKLRSNPSMLKDSKQAITATASWRSGKQSSSARGYTYEWQQARAEWLTMNPLCVMCARRNLVTQATVVDHIKPHQGDMILFWDRTNWQSLCVHCHNALKQRQEHRQR